LVVVYCHHGVRSLSGAAILARAGQEAVASLSGGIDAWSRLIDHRRCRAIDETHHRHAVEPKFLAELAFRKIRLPANFAGHLVLRVAGGQLAGQPT